MPQFLTPDAQTLLRALFKRNPSNRLGYGPDGFEQLKAQPFFSSISWSGLLDRTYPAPYRPVCSPHQASVALDSVSSSPSLKAPVFTRSPTPAASITPYHNGPLGSYGTDHNGRMSDSVYSGFGVDSRSSVEPGSWFAKPLDSNSKRAESNLRLEVTGPSGAIAFPNVKTTPFTDDYELKEVIGRGAHATCQRCVHRRTFEVYAVKCHFIQRTVGEDGSNFSDAWRETLQPKLAEDGVIKYAGAKELPHVSQQLGRSAVAHFEVPKQLI
ncbi:unnamed protein product [Echinostoma caproni]|uniref:Protein kinase domain-containing protein n=1 Tax=Echinostoma caproni TaxID=27848 RepID=A0A183AJX3_9TREM|nr:unnamed protein product [Echinostoma caproni]